MTAQKISICAEAHKEQAEKWREALNNNPPTPQDWKDSGFDFRTLPKTNSSRIASGLAHCRAIVDR